MTELLEPGLKALTLLGYRWFGGERPVPINPGLNSRGCLQPLPPSTSQMVRGVSNFNGASGEQQWHLAAGGSKWAPIWF